MKDKIIETVGTAIFSAIFSGLLGYLIGLPPMLWVVLILCVASAAFSLWLPWPHRTWRLPRTRDEINYVISYRTWRGAFLFALALVVVCSLVGYSAVRQYPSWFMDTVVPAVSDDAFLKKAKIEVRTCSTACAGLALNSSQESALYFLVFGSGQASSVSTNELLDALATQFASKLSDAMMSLAIVIVLLGWAPMIVFEFKGITMFKR